MIVLESTLENGAEVVIKYPTAREELATVLAEIKAAGGTTLALDTETTGLQIFSPDFKIRMVQVGVGFEAWCLDVEKLMITPEDLQFLQEYDLMLHNATYDVLAIRKFFGIALDWGRVTDTKILAHLVDSRGVREGGYGHSLQELTKNFLGLSRTAEDIKGSMKEMAKETGLKVGELFASIDTSNETYIGYAGMDVVLTWGLYQTLPNQIPASAKHLVRYEHEVARVCAEMQYQGFLLDVDYAQALSNSLEEEQTLWEGLALIEYGVESVNTNAEVVQALEEFEGHTLTELTPSGNKRLDEAILRGLEEKGSTLASYVLEAKKVKKQRASWVQNFLDQKDEENKCHANINPLAARTARMSITGIPAQTLPSGDWTVRRCFIADEGQTIVSCDYQAQELRVLAALSGDENMKHAFKTGADLHQITADASGVDRSVGKTVNFAYVYGSGPRNIAESCNISVEKAKQVIQGFERAYPRVKAYSEHLQREAKRLGYVTTPTGRRLYVDRDRPYAALNYMIQSTSRDITARALLRLDEKGFTPYLRIPIHDEIVASVPTRFAKQGSEMIAELMSMELDGVQISTDADVYGPSWGSGYVTDETREAYEATLA